ncbi:hypothetical protein [Natronoflexus pectinivorans]|uniref:Uncharacterized protein n=1 Tax=Natronoflexus pectinivorans TaxID=682526 RepID=A0A4V2RWK1_9BACT|nr:hypothetical protein [Natronoflexus pectinivorans]TCO08828.1 hypothetical protein EV194_104139 [Natronoflexus pectinivorans]
MKEKFLVHTILTLLLGTLAIQDGYSQNCRGYERRCDSAPRYFQSSSLSRAVTLRKGRKIVINQTFFGNREYFISVCGHNRLGKIHFRLIADDEDQTILYDNAADDFKESQLFVILNTMAVKVEISAPHYFDDRGSECAGVRIFYNQQRD